MSLTLAERLRIEADDTRSEDRERLLREAADFIERLIHENRQLMNKIEELTR